MPSPSPQKPDPSQRAGAPLVQSVNIFPVAMEKRRVFARLVFHSELFIQPPLRRLHARHRPGAARGVCETVWRRRCIGTRLLGGSDGKGMGELGGEEEELSSRFHMVCAVEAAVWRASEDGFVFVRGS